MKNKLKFCISTSVIIALSVLAVESVAIIFDIAETKSGFADVVKIYFTLLFLCCVTCLVLTAFLWFYFSWSGKTKFKKFKDVNLKIIIKDFLVIKDKQTRKYYAEIYLAYVFAALFIFVIGVWLARYIIYTVQTPLYAAILSVFSVLILCFVSYLSRAGWMRTGKSALKIFPKTPSLLFLLIVTIVTIAALVFAGQFFLKTNVLPFLPWRILITITFSIILTSVLFIISYGDTYTTVSPLRLLNNKIFIRGAIFLAVIGFLLFGTFSFATGISAKVIESAKGPVSPALFLVYKILDYDGDGYFPMMGIDDCAPFDSTIHPGAIDVPGDSVDNDCDGFDTPFNTTVLPGRHDYDVGIKSHHIPVILITGDAVSAMRMDLHGAKRKTMPKFTEWAHKGVVFDWAFSEGPATRLSFPTMMTGIHALSIKRKRSTNTVAPWLNIKNTIAQVLKRNGYKTVAVSPDKYFSRKVRWLYDGFDTIDDTQAKAGAGVLKNGREITKRALHHLSKLKDEKKFFMWVHYTDAHYPHKLDRNIKPAFGKRVADIYDNELLLLDEHLHKLFAGINNTLAGKEYIMAFTADHGQAFDKRHKKYHQDHDLYTSVTWVPLVFWGKYAKKHLRIQRTAHIMDIMPTFINMLGIKVQDIHGDSLLPEITGQKRKKRPVMQQFFLPENIAREKTALKRTALRYGAYVLYQDIGAKDRLYNYRLDPLERKNLLLKKPELASKLKDFKNIILTQTHSGK